MRLSERLIPHYLHPWLPLVDRSQQYYDPRRLHLRYRQMSMNLPLPHVRLSPQHLLPQQHLGRPLHWYAHPKRYQTDQHGSNRPMPPHFRPYWHKLYYQWQCHPSPMLVNLCQPPRLNHQLRYLSDLLPMNYCLIPYSDSQPLPPTPAPYC